MVRCMISMRDFDGAREIIDQLDDEVRNKPPMVAAIDALVLSEKASQAAAGIDSAGAAVDANPNDLAARQDLAMALLQSVSKKTQWINYWSQSVLTATG